MMEGLEKAAKERLEKENARNLAQIAQELKEIKTALKDIANAIRQKH